KRDECQDGGEVPCKQLYAVYKQWCEENGHKPRSEQLFGKDLRSVIPSLRVTQPRTEEGRERHYVGISLRGTYIAPPRAPRAPRLPTPPDTPDSGEVARDGTRVSSMWPATGEAEGVDVRPCQHPGCTRLGRPYPSGYWCRTHRPHSERNKR